MTRSFPELTSTHLRAFLRRQGWEEVGRGATGSSWVLPGHEDAPAVLLPEGEPDHDTPELVAAAIARLSWALGRSQEDVVEDVVAMTDVLEVRVVDPQTSLGRISVERGAQLVETLKQVIYSGARLYFSGARPGYRGGLPDDARAVVEQLELAPPAAGSFKLQVVANVPPQLVFEGAEPPADRVHETLVSSMKALQAARDAAEAEAVPEDADELDDAVEQGVSTNLLNAVIKLDTQSPALRVEFRGSWGQRDADALERVVIEPRHFARFPALRDVLAQKDPREDYQLVGWIRGVVVDELALDQGLRGVFIVEAELDGVKRDVRVELVGDEFRAARAGAGEHYLIAAGTLERIRRDWHLTAPRGVRITAQRPPELD